ncbi:hypothetical protein BX265_2811 [Streptomyces sp. TLI_235]|nr:hypothetical protein [Streptomyces sp. TLI_235]PBC78052.1 hypothetical protein BX265_2811 [Streptomyces sp. TLI_235]
MTRYPRHLAALLLAGSAGLAAAPLASAADGPAAPAPIAPAELSAAGAAAGSPAALDRIGRFFAREGRQSFAAGLSPAEEARAAAQAAPALVGGAVAVYSLNEGFVAGTAGAPVARVELVAGKAVAADGRTASVWTVHDGGGWRVVNIASGSDETDYPAQAAATGGGTAFREPQIDAWYVLRSGRVLPLDEDARRSVGPGGTTLADYQRLVHARYGDRLPGSAYDRAGTGGGWAAEQGAAAEPSPRGPAVAAGAALAVTALVGAGLAVRRRGARR